MTNPMDAFDLLDDVQIEDIIGSTSPEEAYKKFCDAVSRALPELIHDAVVSEAARIRRTRGINGASGWLRYLQALAIDMRWGQPGLRTAPSSVVAVHAPAEATGTVRLSVCVGAHF